MAEGFGAMDRLPCFTVQIRRMAREIGRCRTGLALSSGGARGLAHIGVIQVLEENGIEIDIVAGSSMGAYVAAHWAYGHDGIACEKIARDIERRWGWMRLVDPVIPPRQGFMRTRRVGQWLRRGIGNIQFMELARPLRVVATDFETLDRVVFSSGEVARAVEASIAIPGICVPTFVQWPRADRRRHRRSAARGRALGHGDRADHRGQYIADAGAPGHVRMDCAGEDGQRRRRASAHGSTNT